MDELFAEYKLDLEKIRAFLELIDLVKQFASFDDSILRASNEQGATVEPKLEGGSTATLIEKNIDNTLPSLLLVAKSSKANLPVLSGTLVLYLCGRFEYYVRSVFEELSMQIATRCGTYERLPREMKKELINMTAEVISNPRKYGHAENGVTSFVENLYKNLKNNDVSTINFQCLSITFENMRAETLEKLFSKAGLKAIWENLGAQNELRLYFETNEVAQARSKAQTLLDEIMTIRNNIAHPSNDTTFPDSSKVTEFLNFFEMLASTIKDCAKVHVHSLNR